MYTDIKSFEDACKALNYDPTLPEFPMASADEKKALIAHYKLTVIAKAINEGWTPNWGNSNQWKYFPWFKMSDGFSFRVAVCNLSHSRVGSRLCFQSEEKAEYAGKQFIKLYKEYFT